MGLPTVKNLNLSKKFPGRYSSCNLYAFSQEQTDIYEAKAIAKKLTKSITGTGIRLEINKRLASSEDSFQRRH